MLQILFPSQIEPYVDTLDTGIGTFTPLFITSNQSTTMEEFLIYIHLKILLLTV